MHLPLQLKALGALEDFWVAGSSVWWSEFKADCLRLAANGLACRDGFVDTNKVNPITVLSILLWPHKPVLILP